MLERLAAKIWKRPEGLAWRVTEKATLKSRQAKYQLFMKELRPLPSDSILDVGISNIVGRGTNFLELWYPYKERIFALGVGSEEEYADFRKAFPQVRLVLGDGRSLDFPDNAFDIVFSNAVVEHVGTRREQKRFITELVRVGRKAFITTPNYWFPVDSHTLLPFAHYLPVPFRYPLYRKLGKAYWADVNHLNLLTPAEFRYLFPENCGVRIIKRRMFGITATMTALVEK